MTQSPTQFSIREGIVRNEAPIRFLGTSQISVFLGRNDSPRFRLACAPGQTLAGSRAPKDAVLPMEGLERSRRLHPHLGRPRRRPPPSEGREVQRIAPLGRPGDMRHRRKTLARTVRLPTAPEHATATASFGLFATRMTATQSAILGLTIDCFSGASAAAPARFQKMPLDRPRRPRRRGGASGCICDANRPADTPDRRRSGSVIGPLHTPFSQAWTAGCETNRPRKGSIQTSPGPKLGNGVRAVACSA